MIQCSQLGACGRLGNQLWQVASTIGVATAANEPFCFPRWAYEPFFMVKPEWFVDEPTGTDINEYVQHMDERTRAYLQDYGLWREVREAVCEWLQPSGRAKRHILLDHPEFAVMRTPQLAIHVRRGDNATAHLRGEEGHHPLRPMSYYREALERFSPASIAVFSDDIPWCEENLSDLGAYFFKGGSPRPKEHEPAYLTAPVEDWIDLVAMTYCDQFILSNSTYSWWGAFLSGVPGKDIVRPSPWFGPKLHYIQEELMFPEDWIKLEHAT